MVVIEDCRLISEVKKLEKEEEKKIGKRKRKERKQHALYLKGKTNIKTFVIFSIYLCGAQLN